MGKISRHSIALVWNQFHINYVPTKIEILKADGPGQAYVKVAD